MDCFVKTGNWYFKQWQTFGIQKYYQNFANTGYIHTSYVFMLLELM